MRKPKEPIVPVNSWWCDTCNDKKEMTKADMLEHIRSMHHLDTTGLKCSRSMIQHLDGADWFSSVYEVKIVTPSGTEIKLTNSTLNPRKNNDPMAFQD